MRLFSLFTIAVALISLPALAQNEAAAPAPSAAPTASPLEWQPSLQEISPDLLKGLEAYWRPDAPAPDAPQAVELTVDNVVKMALENNPQVLIAQEDIAEAQAQVNQARAAQRPQVAADTSFIRVEPMHEGAGSLGSLGSLAGMSGLSAPLKIVGGLLQPGGVDVSDLAEGAYSLLFPIEIPEVDKDWRRDHFSIKQVIYSGGQIKAAIAASRFLAESQEWRRQVVLNDLEYQARQAYYNALLARALIVVGKESVATFERHLADTQQMLDVGLVSNFELLRAQTELNARQSDLVTAQNALRLTLANLRRVLALPQTTEVRLVGDLDLRPVAAPLPELTTEALAKRPEINALDKALQASEMNLKRAKGQYMPQVAGNVEWTNNDGGSLESQNGWTFAGGVQYDIYAGGRRKGEVMQAKSQLNNLQHQRTQLSQLVEFDVQRAYIQLQDSLAKIREDRGTVELARESRRLAELRFQEGVGTQLEVLDAELALTQAETKLVQDFRDYATARAALDQAIGVSSGLTEAVK